MIQKLKNIIKKIVFIFIKPPIQIIHNTYSQVGEDSIVAFLFAGIGLRNFTYLDIGANKPDYCNNTYLFYTQGQSGVCIEPDPYMFEAIKKIRPKDRCFNVAVGLEDTPRLDFYLFDEPSLSTLSKEEAEHRQSYGRFKIKEILTVPVVTISTVFEKYFEGLIPHFVSLDVEGLDLAILKTNDFNKYRPFVFCVETCGYSQHHIKPKQTGIIDFMLSKNYFIYADTYVNTIFVAKEQFENPQTYFSNS